MPIDEELYYNALMKRVKASRHKAGVTEFVSDTSGSYNTGGQAQQGL